MLPERSNVFDVGVVQKLGPNLEVGISAYYKTAKDLLDDGQFGAAYVLTAPSTTPRPTTSASN